MVTGDEYNAAYCLVELRKRRDFWRDRPGQERAFQAEVSSLAKGLHERLRDLSDRLGEGMILELDTKTTFGLSLREKGSTEPVGRCYINAANLGVIHLQLLGRGLDEQSQSLVMDVRQHSIIWRRGSTDVSDLAAFVVTQFLDLCGDVMKRETPEPLPAAGH
jgi:hypothetical protein